MSEWQRHGPRRDSCCSGCASDQEGMVPGYINPQLAWPGGQREGDQCMDNAKRPGHIHNGRCVADRRDSAVINQGEYGVEGGPCGPDGEGRLVRENGELVCRPRSDFDAASVAQVRRDAAYSQMVAGMQDAWRNPRRS